MATNYPSEQRDFNQNQNYGPPPQYQQQPPSQVPIYQSMPPQQNYQAQYAQPIVSPAVIAVPQTVVINQPVRCRTEPLNTACPFCKAQIVTLTNTSINWKACFVCCITCYIGYIFIQCTNDKDFGINDCSHTCPNCGQLVGKYYAM